MSIVLVQVLSWQLIGTHGFFTHVKNFRSAKFWVKKITDKVPRVPIPDHLIRIRAQICLRLCLFLNILLYLIALFYTAYHLGVFLLRVATSGGVVLIFR